MADLDQTQAVPGARGMSSKRKEALTAAMQRTSEWISVLEIPSDVTVRVGESSFPLHKFFLLPKSGYIRKLLSESSDADVALIEIPDMPGGSDAFELAAKFCYGVNFEINAENIARIHCAAHYLEMTEEYAAGNLVGRTEAYLNEVAFQSLSSAVLVLQKAENLLPVAEKIKLIGRCVDAIAYVACKDNHFSSETDVLNPKPIVDWWAEDLAGLKIDTFQRVLIAMMARGFKQHALGPVVMLYAQKSLRGLEICGKGAKKIEPRQEHEKRVILETVVSLLPQERDALSVSFLSMLLRASIYLETTVACRLDLEKRMAMQLGQAVLDDLLIPSYSFTGDTLFDVDTVRRIMMNYLELEVDQKFSGGEEEYLSPPTNDMERVGKLMETYLAEIASDRHLTVSKFIGLAELVPEQSRVTEDGMYRAIDIYLKAHPGISDVERKKVCSLMDCQKLSREACAHAAQNGRLPVQTVVQVLYYEQQRLRDARNGADSPVPPSPRPDPVAPSRKLNPFNDEVSVLRRENQDLKLELFKLRMRLKEMEKSEANSSSGNNPARSSADKPPLPKKSIMSAVSKKLGRLYPFVRGDGITGPSKGRKKPNKDRRHSIS